MTTPSPPPAFRGRVEAHALVFFAALLGEAEARARVLELWLLGTTVYALPDDGDWLVLFGEARSLRAEHALGLPVATAAAGGRIDLHGQAVQGRTTSGAFPYSTRPTGSAWTALPGTLWPRWSRRSPLRVHAGLATLHDGQGRIVVLDLTHRSLALNLRTALRCGPWPRECATRAVQPPSSRAARIRRYRASGTLSVRCAADS
ncbi:bpX6 domain-containing protein [Streptomyces sp. NBC_00390]|uniref:bpX6 domain-containing protein n=1 Tax=Streptomyces sp. NBC_00390 TaxID=2975736 RepID=UPI002E1F646C